MNVKLPNNGFYVVGVGMVMLGILVSIAGVCFTYIDGPMGLIAAYFAIGGVLMLLGRVVDLEIGG